MYIFLAYVSLGSIAVPLLLWLSKAKYNFKIPFLRAMLVLLLVTGGLDLIAYVLSKMGMSNIPVINIFFILQFYLLSYIYSIYLKKNIFIKVSVIVFSVLIIINALFIQPFNQMQSWSDGLQSVLLIFYGIICHKYLLRHLSADESKDYMLFWVNMAFMFYFSLNLYIFFTSNYLFNNETSDIVIIVWAFHNCFNVIKNVMLAVGIYYAGKLKIENLHKQI
ncbi:MAG: hypothetical protein ACKOW2_05975 [Sphingobacteriaceae bacterium]